MKGLPARVTALPPRLQDAVVAVALTLINIGTLLPYRGQLHPQAVAFILVALETLPLIWRRTWPVAVFLVIGIAREIYDQVPLGYAPLPLGPAIAYFTVMDRCSTRVRLAISLLVLAGIIESQSTPGHSQPYEFSVAVLVFVAAGMAGIVSRTRRAYLAEVETRAAQAESELDNQAALAAARERSSIARELHDVVAHHVSLMAVQAEAAASLLPGHPVQARSSVEIIGQTAREALTELRRLLGVLRGPAERPETAPSPSLDELDALLGVVRGAGLAVDLHVIGQPLHLAHGVDLTAYRIVQEALTNTLRHAPQATAAVTLSYEPGYLTVAVIDSGPGTLAATGALRGTGTVTRPRMAAGPDAAAPAAAGPPVAAPSAAGVATAGPAAAGPAAAGPAAAGPAAAGAVRLADQASATVTADRPARQPRNPLGGPAPAGFGLAGIVERVASCGGSLTVGPTEAGGFAVTARLPVR